MNYQPVTVGNQTHPSAGFQDKFNAEKAGEEIDQQYVLFLVWSSGSTNPQNNDGDATFDRKEHDFDAKKHDIEVNVSPSNSAQSRRQDDKTKKKAKGKSLVESLTGYKDLSVEFEELEDITYFDDDNDVGAEADFNNLETSIAQKKDGIFISQDKYVAEILRKFGLSEGKSACTPIDTTLLKDPDVIMSFTFAKTHNMVTYLSKSNASEGFNQILDFLNGSSIKYALTLNSNIYVSCIKQIWNTIVIKQANDITRLKALVDKKKVVVTEAAIREKVFANIRRIGKGFSGVETPLFEVMLVDQEIDAEMDAYEHVEEVNASDAAQGDDSAAHRDLPTVTTKPSIPSPTPPTPPP
nr:hypothetical protein [Tanacetum cinerariifolium]